MRFDARQIAGLCNGSTPDSDSVCEGSNPSPAAKNRLSIGQPVFLWFLYFLDCQRIVKPKCYGGKKSVKGNRQGFLSRQITRRSGRIAKQYYKKFCNFEGSLAKGQKGLFDKLTVRLAGRYISFLRLDVEKVALVIARPCRGRGNLAGSLRIFGKLRRIRNILCEISTSLRPPLQ